MKGMESTQSSKFCGGYVCLKTNNVSVMKGTFHANIHLRGPSLQTEIADEELECTSLLVCYRLTSQSHL
jgi:hypothetical protein